MVDTVDQVQTSFRSSAFSHSLGPHIAYGKVIHVDSNHTSASNGNLGTQPDKPCATLDGAVGKCIANAGYTILLAPNHSETLTAADAVDIDVAGVTVIGLGEGSARPLFDYTDAAGEVVIGADNVRIENINCCNGVRSSRTVLRKRKIFILAKKIGI